MKRAFRILGLAALMTTALALSIGGAAFAAARNTDSGNRGEDCPYGECVDCDPNEYLWLGTNGAGNGTPD